MAQSFVSHTAAVPYDGNSVDLIHGDGGAYPYNDRTHGTYISTDMWGWTSYGTAPWTGNVISSGTAASQAPLANHRGIVRISSSTTAPSGYYYTLSAGSGDVVVFAGGEVYETIFSIINTTSFIMRIGFQNATSATAPTRGAWLDINGTTVSGYTNDGTHAASQTPTYTCSTATWYYAKVFNNAGNSAWTFQLYTCADGVKQFDQTLTVGGSIYSPLSGMGAITVTGGSGSAIALVDVDFMSIAATSGQTR